MKILSNVLNKNVQKNGLHAKKTLNVFQLSKIARKNVTLKKHVGNFVSPKLVIKQQWILPNVQLPIIASARNLRHLSILLKHVSQRDAWSLLLNVLMMNFVLNIWSLALQKKNTVSSSSALFKKFPSAPNYKDSSTVLGIENVFDF